MSSVYFDPAVGGDGSTVSDDAHPTTGLGNGGHRSRWLSALGNLVPICRTAINAATAAAASISSETYAGTSTSALAVGLGNKTVLAQAGKGWFIGQWLQLIAGNNAWMVGQVVNYGGAILIVNVTAFGGSGTPASWTILPGSPPPNEEIINGVPVTRQGGLYHFSRIAVLPATDYPRCLTVPSQPIYIQLLEFTMGAANGSFFEVTVSKAHRGMGGDRNYYEYLMLNGMYGFDSVGGIARRYAQAANRICLFTSDATNVSNEITVPGDGQAVPFVAKQINSDNNDKKYALMLKVLPNCGADESLGITARYSDPHARPAVNFMSVVKPAYPNL
ncbi:hypothetical protein ACUHMQ_13460 [Chitinimonas sp. PSY-7]|uniref:hypothetical protein n=1 Tax=Chitinimonas sp. PSY-7 TaxID=3459088 RepID=UPI00403FEAA5